MALTESYLVRHLSNDLATYTNATRDYTTIKTEESP